MNRTVKLSLWTSLRFVKGGGYEVYRVSGSPEVKIQTFKIYYH